jgi:hypothetical protein
VRVNVFVPDELFAAIREHLPGLNVSRTLQDALAALLGCEHGCLACAACGTTIDRADVVAQELDAFYGDVLNRLEPLVWKVGTAEGAARILRDVALRYGVTAAGWRPLPRPTRAERQLALDIAFEAAS